MKPFTVHHGLVAPLDRSNVDTDAILAKQFLKSTRRTGYGPFLFDQWRYLDEGHLGMDVSQRRPNPDFVLNQPRYRTASILLSRRNFGCGSSREHAPWALEEYGFRAIIAESFADIFRDNCLKNGLLPVALATDQVERLFVAAQAEGFALTVDLQACRIVLPAGEWIAFEIREQARQKLLNGWDDVDLALQLGEKILDFERRQRAEHPWLHGLDI